jgi:hypothetical protein
MTAPLEISKRMLVQREPGGPQLHYLRHFVLLAIIAAVLLTPVIAKPLYGLRDRLSWHGVSGYDAEFALYGLLHALAVSVSLRGHRPVWRLPAFVIAAALLNVGVLHLGLLIVRLQSAPISSAPVILVPACLGAIAYGLLARLPLRFRASWIPLAPVACFFGSLLGMIGAHLVSNFTMLMAVWWFAFSAWLYCADQWSALVRRARASAAERG